MADSTFPSLVRVWEEIQGKLPSTASSSSSWEVPRLKQLELGVYEVYTPPVERPELEIILESVQPFEFKNSNGERPSRVSNSLEDLCTDPITMDLMCDPVKCNDGRTYCRWTIVEKRMNTSPYDRNMKLVISCDDITLRSLLFSEFSDQESKFRERRNQHREEALQHARADPVELEDAIEKLNNVLKWDPRDTECETELAKVLDLVEHQNLSLLDTIPEVGHEDVMALLDTIPEVRHEDVIGARIDNEGGRFFAFLLLCYITTWNTLVKIGNDHHVFSEASPAGSPWLARRAS
ncbi:unnamed protein product [Calypogeia fissa]